MAAAGNIIAFEQQGTVGILTINNPPQNYIPQPDFIDIDQLKTWTASPGLKGIIVTGAGRHFSAGADRDMLDELSRDPELLQEKIRRGREILDFLADIEIPTIAAIRGACFGAGLEIALTCHIRVCADNALFAFPEANLGIMPGLSGTSRLPARIGTGRSIEMVLGGDTVDGTRAHELRIVEHAVPAKEVMDFSIGLMRKMTEDRPLSVIHSIVRAINNFGRLPASQAMDEETLMFCRLASDEAQREKK